MDFFEHQADAKRHTLWLYVLFALATLAVAAAVYVAVTASLYVFAFFMRDVAYPLHFWEVARFWWVSSISLLAIFAGSWYKIRQLQEGGGIAIAKLLGGEQLKTIRHPLERQLRNVVEEMAVASGVLTPAIFVLEQRGVNAFAAGYTPQDTVIAVTRGTMEMLSRDELQGVIAHEFSHILHGDTIIKMKTMGLLYGITMISDLGILMIAGRYSPRYSTHRRAMMPLFMLSGVLFFTVGLLGMLAADLIKAALSRQREYLADAAAVQFTRNPDGIAGALKVIGGYKDGSRLNLSAAKQVSHLFFGDAMKSWWSSDWWATHPPLVSRIQRIEPSFRGRIAKVNESRVRFQNERHATSMFAPIPSQQQVVKSVAQVMQSVGGFELENLQDAQTLLNGIPNALRDAFSDVRTAQAVLYNTILDKDKSIMKEQMLSIRQHSSSAMLAEVMRVRTLLPDIKPELRLPLLDVLTPHLLGLSSAKRKSMFLVFKSLIGANQQVDLFEYLIYQHFLYAFSLQKKKKTTKKISLVQLQEECAVLLSIVSQLSSHQAPQLVYQESMQRLFAKPQQTWTLDARHTASNIKRLSEILPQLDACCAADKKRLLQALVYAILRDGRVSVEEAEIMRLIAMMLGCPMPLLSVNSLQKKHGAN